MKFELMSSLTTQYSSNNNTAFIYLFILLVWYYEIPLIINTSILGWHHCYVLLLQRHYTTPIFHYQYYVYNYLECQLLRISTTTILDCAVNYCYECYDINYHLSQYIKKVNTILCSYFIKWVPMRPWLNKLT